MNTHDLTPFSPHAASTTAPSLTSALTEQLLDALPQTQCTKCGYQGCRPYAEAMAQGLAASNRCPPGGQAGVIRLSKLLNQLPQALDSSCGEEKGRALAVVDEAHCIGCTLCIQACPVDAIIGAPKQLHFVVPDLCTGCDLCVAPCPVDCIDMVTITTTTGWAAWGSEQALAARQRYEQRSARLVREKEENDLRLQAKAAQKLAEINQSPTLSADAARKKAIIQAAIERARLKQAATLPAASAHDKAQ